MDNPCFNFASVRDGTTLRLTLTGDFDKAVTGQVERALEAARELPLEQIIFDLSALTFLDLAGLRTILNAHRRAQSQAIGVTVIRPRGHANRVFTLTRVGETLPLTDP